MSNTSASSADEKEPQVLVIGYSAEQLVDQHFLKKTGVRYDFCETTSETLRKSLTGEYEMICVKPEMLNQIEKRIDLFNTWRLGDYAPIGMAFVGTNQEIVWHNHLLMTWTGFPEIVGRKYYDVLRHPEMIGPSFCPFHTAMSSGKTSTTTIQLDESNGDFLKNNIRFALLEVFPIVDICGTIHYFLTFLRDVTSATATEKKYELLRNAGSELAALSKSDIETRSPEERTELLRAKIVKYTREILNFDAVEVRLLSEKHGGLLEPLLSIGLKEEAHQRVLYARPDGFGVTGHVAFHAKSYIVDDASDDPFFVEGVEGTQSSLTSPLVYRGKVIGTFNVESSVKRAFTAEDQLFLEVFCRDVAFAIHSLDLLSLEMSDTARRSLRELVNCVHSPLSRILSEAAIGMQSVKDTPAIAVFFKNIQKQVRHIQSTFVKTDTAIMDFDTPLHEQGAGVLRDKRTLVVDYNENIGSEIGQMLFPYGCTVELAFDGEAALDMIECCDYDAVFCNIKLRDISAYDFFERYRTQRNTFFVPIIFMKNFGHDQEHVMTRAREAGAQGFISCEPLILHQVLSSLRSVMEENAKQMKSKGTGV